MALFGSVVLTMWCFIGDGGEGGGKRTYSYSTAPHSDKWEKLVVGR
jgi:hypothetical protein